MNDRYIKAKLKSVAEIIAISNLSHRGSRTLENQRFHINEEMYSKFGDGNIYTFRRDSHGYYTHTCEEDKYLYHSDWFITEEMKPKAEGKFMFDPEEIV